MKIAVMFIPVHLPACTGTMHGQSRQMRAPHVCQGEQWGRRASLHNTREGNGQFLTFMHGAWSSFNHRDHFKSWPGQQETAWQQGE